MTLRVSMENEVRGLIYDLTQKVNNYEDHREIMLYIERKLAGWKRMHNNTGYVIKNIVPPMERATKQASGPVAELTPTNSLR